MKSQLYLWDKLREKLIAEIELYENTYFERIQPIFANVEIEAEKVQQDYYDRIMNATTDGDFVLDPSDLADNAIELGIDYYEKYSLMRYNNLAMWITMLYQYWEQQVRLFLFREENQTFDLNFKDFCKNGINDIKEEFLLHNVNIESLNCWREINIFRLVCNTLKHGDGNAARQLQNLEPKFFIHEDLRNFDILDLYKSTLLNEVLTITDDDYKHFSKVLVSFWNELPERMFSNEIS